jgi:hypothetical protein
MLREYTSLAEDSFVHDFCFPLDTPDELEHSTCTVLLRQMRPLREGGELKRLSFGPARVKSVLRRLIVP